MQMTAEETSPSGRWVRNLLTNRFDSILQARRQAGGEGVFPPVRNVCEYPNKPPLVERPSWEGKEITRDEGAGVDTSTFWFQHVVVRTLGEERKKKWCSRQKEVVLGKTELRQWRLVPLLHWLCVCLSVSILCVYVFACPVMEDRSLLLSVYSALYALDMS